MAGFCLERAVVGPEIGGVVDAGDTSFIYHLRRLSAGDRELEVGILLPVAEKKRKFRKEAIVDFAQGGNGLRTGVAVDTSLKSLDCPNEFLPGLVVIGVDIHLRPELLELGTLLIVGPEGVHQDAVCQVGNPRPMLRVTGAE